MFLDRFEVEVSVPADSGTCRHAPGAEPDTEMAALYARHRGDVMRFCLKKLGNYDDAADITQEAFYRFLKKPDRETVQRPRAFLIETAMNLIRDKRRAELRQKKKAHVALELVSDAELVCPAPLAESSLQSRQIVGMALEALSELPPKCQAVFVMKLYYGLSYREIAAELNISSIVGVKKYMMRALGHLRDNLDIDEIRTNCEPARGLPANGNSVNGHSISGVARQLIRAAE